MPNENITRAIKRVTESLEKFDDFTVEAYGPDGVAIYIVGITDNTNRSIPQIKNILKDYDTKIGEPGSVLWAFDRTEDGFVPKFAQDISDSSRNKLNRLVEELVDREDIQEIYTNAAE